MYILYRVIKEPSSLVRRLKCVSQLLHLVGDHQLNRDVLAVKLRDWSKTHTEHLDNYKYSTGGAHSIKKKEMTLLATNYIDLTVKFKLISKITNVFQPTRIGRVLLSLLKNLSDNEENQFCLNPVERIFYIYQILQHDADTVLTILNMIQLLENTTNKNLQNNFQQRLLERLKAKISTSSQEHITSRLHDRQVEVMTRWKKPEGYAAYILPPRLHWLLDLGLLDLKREKNNFIYHLTETGQSLVDDILPKLPNSNIMDVTDSWFNTQFFSKVTPLIISPTNFRQWQDVDDQVRQKACEKLLPAAFDTFQRTNIPKISLTQGVIYLCIRCVTELHLLTNVEELIQWFQIPRILENYKYEVRISARENESYFVRRHA